MAPSADRASLLDRLANLIVNIDIEGVKSATDEAIGRGIAPSEIIDSMSRGMQEVGKRYERRQYFVPELLIAGEAMKEGLAILKPHLKAESGAACKVVVGTVRGDLHDIGKNIFISLLESGGFEVYDLDVDVPPERFVAKVKEVNARILGMSSLLTTTIPEIKTVIETLKRAGMRDRVRVIVGGAAVTQEFVNEVGADSFARDALVGVETCKRWAREE